MPLPTYKLMGDHTESVRVYFETEKITYEELLSHFWSSHSPTRKSCTQYKSAIWCHSEEQLKKVNNFLFLV